MLPRERLVNTREPRGRLTLGQALALCGNQCNGLLTKLRHSCCTVGRLRDHGVMESSRQAVYDEPVTPHTPTKPPSLTVGYAVLTLQSLTTPFLIAGSFSGPTDRPAWLTGLLLALDLGSLASLAILAFGRRTGHPVARFAPLALVFPAWLALAALAPLQDSGPSAPVFTLCALLMGLTATAPFLRPGAERRFESRRSAEDTSSGPAQLA